MRPEEIRALHLETDATVTEALRAQWAGSQIEIPLEVVPCPTRKRGDCLAGYARSYASPEVQLTLIVPGPAHLSFWQRLRVGRSWSGLVSPLRDLENLSVVVVREHGGAGHASSSGRIRVSPRTHHVAIILVDQVDRSVLKAIRYARAVEASDIRALHAAVDPHRAERLAEQWGEMGHVLGVPLDVEECFDRNIARTVSEYVHRVQGRDVEVTVVLPRREYPRTLQRLLHDHTSRAIARALESEPHVDVVVVPYRVGSDASTGRMSHR